MQTCPARFMTGRARSFYEPAFTVLARRKRERDMGRRAKHVYIDADDIAMLEKRVDELAVNAAVRIVKNDGEVVEGVVSVTPTVQVFLDPDDREGMNGVVRLIDRERPDWDGLIWLGDIRDVRHLDSVRTGTSKA